MQGRHPGGSDEQYEAGNVRSRSSQNGCEALQSRSSSVHTWEWELVGAQLLAHAAELHVHGGHCSALALESALLAIWSIIRMRTRTWQRQLIRAELLAHAAELHVHGGHCSALALESALLAIWSLISMRTRTWQRQLIRAELLAHAAELRVHGGRCRALALQDACAAEHGLQSQQRLCNVIQAAAIALGRQFLHAQQ